MVCFTSILTAGLAMLPLSSMVSGWAIGTLPDGNRVAIGFKRQTIGYKNHFIKVTQADHTPDNSDTGYPKTYEEENNNRQCLLQAQMEENQSFDNAAYTDDCKILRDWAKESHFLFSITTRIIEPLNHANALFMAATYGSCGYAFSYFDHPDSAPLGDRPITIGSFDMREHLNKAIDDFSRDGKTTGHGAVQCDQGRARHFRIVNTGERPQ